MASRLLSSSVRNLYKVSIGSQSRISSTLLVKRNATEGGIPRDEEQATGLEKKELEKMLEGDMDPFNLKVNTGPRGTRESPTKVPSMLDERLVGCICEEDATFINWMTLEKGKPKRCECGHFFELVHGPSQNIP